jgi:hypothetical protein
VPVRTCGASPSAIARSIVEAYLREERYTVTHPLDVPRSTKDAASPV